MGSTHLIKWCNRIQTHTRTATVAARFHLKSTIAIAYIAWQMFCMSKPYTEWEYMCYKAELGEYHIKRLKRYILAAPEFSDYLELTDAEGRIHYGYNGMEFIATPSGILSFNRGRHPDGLICDDILRDPTTRLDIGQLKKIEQIFFEDVESMPMSELHIFGTPQHQSDLFSSLEKKTDYNVRRYPAIVNYDNQVTLWPDRYNFDWLMKYKLRVGDKAFAKEMMCSPVHSEEGFFQPEQLDKCIRARLNNYRVNETKPNIRKPCYGGFDIGKKVHPSHLSVVAVDRKRRFVQVHSQWMDGWEYREQRDYLEQAIKQFNIVQLYYDDTRAEFESFKESGELPGEMRPLTFSARSKFELAGGIDKAMTQDKLLLLEDERQKNQLLNVDNDLQSADTSDGHGDCFWSNAMAIKAAEKGEGNIVWEL